MFGWYILLTGALPGKRTMMRWSRRDLCLILKGVLEHSLLAGFEEGAVILTGAMLLSAAITYLCISPSAKGKMLLSVHDLLLSCSNLAWLCSDIVYDKLSSNCLCILVLTKCTFSLLNLKVGQRHVSANPGIHIGLYQTPHLLPTGYSCTQNNSNFSLWQVLKVLIASLRSLWGLL